MKNAKHILLMYAGTPVDRLPEEIRSRVEENPELKARLESQARVAGLMKLKNHEIPDEALEGRVRYRVGIRIRNGEHLRTASTLDALPDWARMVAVVVVMFGLSLLTHREMLEDPQVENDLQAAAQVEIVEPIPTDTGGPYLFQPDSFSTLVLNPDPAGEVWNLTPERRLKIEESLLELGLTETNRTQQVNTLPVMFQFP
ncbi:MAG: hypothetical protein WD708_04985 [Kiritimatiellia bacterium]